MDNISLEFKPPFTLDKYELFLKAKKLPERQLTYDWRSDMYTITTHKRFAKALGLKGEEYRPTRLHISPFLFDYQKFIVKQALASKKYACFADCGLGKTNIFLEFAKHVRHKTKGKVLIFSPLQIIPQTQDESNLFYNGRLPILKLATRDDLVSWLKGGSGNQLAITNYEKMVDGMIPELRRLSGIIADESSILKTKGGTIKWNLMKSTYGIEYKLSCTATPAPNDLFEYASQAGFLDKFNGADGGEEGAAMWVYFNRDKSGKWKLKAHAYEDFYRWLASWSIYIRNPAHYGFEDNQKDIPAPQFHNIPIEQTPEQAELELAIRRDGRVENIFGDMNLGVTKRGKLSQLAKGFLYQKGEEPMRVHSLKPGRVANLIRRAVEQGEQVLVWTVFDEEGQILLEELGDTCNGGVKARNLTGKMKEEERLKTLDDFRRGRLPVLLSKPELLGFGLNFQFCTCMVFSGWDDSYERFYQAIKRAHRYGQKKPLKVYLPFIPSLEGAILDNVFRKKDNFEADARKHEEVYRKVLEEMGEI